MRPWTDRSNAFSPLKATVFALCLLPAGWIAWQYANAALGPRPYNGVVHESGLWMVRFLMASLAITPLRRVTGWNKLIAVRRMLGVTAAAYGAGHLVFYALDMNGDLLKVVSEIVLRPYLTIGFVALSGLALLAATSTDGAIRRLGKAWGKLHRLVFPIAVLGLLHFFMQSKIDVSQAAIMSGLFIWLVGARLIVRRHALTPAVLVGLTLAAALLTVGLEAAWYGLATNVPPMRVLAANLTLAAGLRPAWWVLIAGLMATGLNKQGRLSLFWAFHWGRKRLTRA